MLHKKLSPLHRRLLPLYIGTFLQAVVFWYAIEKLFMFSIGFNNFTVGVMVAVMSIVMLAVETPSGILADRWSRKGVSIIAAVALAISAFIAAISYSVPMYIISCVFWGIFASMYSGTYDSIIYDTTIEEHGDSKTFEKNLGILRAVEGIAFVVGALSASLIASKLGMRDAYVLSIPLILLSLPFLAIFREPTLHKAEVTEPVIRHMRMTFGAVLKNKFLLYIIIAIVGFAALQELVLELSQLWYIALSTPVSLFGIIGAIIFVTWSVGGLIVPYLKSQRAEIILLATMTVSTGAHIFSRSYWVTLVAMFVTLTAAVALGVILSRIMHDELPANVRAGSASVVSTLARVTIIPSSLLFTYIANTKSVFLASYIILFICVIAVLSFMAHGLKTKSA